MGIVTPDPHSEIPGEVLEMDGSPWPTEPIICDTCHAPIEGEAVGILGVGVFHPGHCEPQES